jgi:putative inorganic carbon (HCO3(-)) transporter
VTSAWTGPRALPVLVGAAAGSLALLLLLRKFEATSPSSAFIVVALVTAVGALAYVAWVADPVWPISAGIVLSCLSSNWDAVGFPSSVAPDRLLLATGLLAVVVGGIRSSARISFRPQPVHVVLVLVIAYAVASAIAVGTIGDRAAIFRIVDRLGVVPFAIFMLSPLIFRGPQQRAVLLGVLVAFGGYLGLTALFETVGPRALVFPQFILDPEFGIHADRARGPFIEAVPNGFALFACGVAAVIALITWQSRLAKVAAVAVVVLCALGVLFTLTRSVWLGAGAATMIVLLVNGGTRRFAVPVLVCGAILVAGALTLVPGLSGRASERAEKQGTVWDRKNLNRAAINMIEERPLLGFGWFQFRQQSAPYFELADDYPLTESAGLELHNGFLVNATELGLLGTTLWALGLLLGVGGALAIRGPPELLPWRLGLAAIAICWVVVANFVNPTAFQPLLLWTWAGAVWAAAPRQPDLRGTERTYRDAAPGLAGGPRGSS